MIRWTDDIIAATAGCQGRRFMRHVLTFLSALLVLFVVGAHAQDPVSLTGYKLPTKEQKLDPKNLERILSAKTVCVLAASMPFIAKEGKAAQVMYRGGRVGPEHAKADVEKILSEWGAFSLVENPNQADLVLVIEEQTLAPSWKSDGQARLRDTLAIFPTGGPGVAPPLWVGIDTESALLAPHTLRPDAEGVVKKFRRDVENARNRLKK